MRVRLKRDVCCCAFRFRARLLKRNRFGVPNLFIKIVAFAYNLAALPLAAGAMGCLMGGVIADFITRRTGSVILGKCSAL